MKNYNFGLVKAYVGLMLVAMSFVGSQGAFANEKLMKAVRAGDVAQVARQLTRGADVNYADSSGNSPSGATPLMDAAFHGYTDIVRQFLAHPKINVNQADKYGYTALSWAIKMNRQEIANMIRARMAGKVPPSYAEESDSSSEFGFDLFSEDSANPESTKEDCTDTLLLTLPNEITETIFEHLEPASLWALRATCKEASRIVIDSKFAAKIRQTITPKAQTITPKGMIRNHPDRELFAMRQKGMTVFAVFYYNNNKFTLQQYIDADYTILDLLSIGVPLYRLRNELGCTVNDIIRAGVPVSILKSQPGYSALELGQAGIQ